MLIERDRKTRKRYCFFSSSFRVNDGSLWGVFLFGVGGIRREFYIVFFSSFFLLPFFSVRNRMLDFATTLEMGCYHAEIAILPLLKVATTITL